MFHSLFMWNTGTVRIIAEYDVAGGVAGIINNYSLRVSAMLIYSVLIEIMLRRMRSSENAAYQHRMY